MLKVINDVTRIFILCITTLYPLIRKKTMKTMVVKKKPTIMIVIIKII